jgi:hypothetical protein
LRARRRLAKIAVSQTLGERLMGKPLAAAAMLFLALGTAPLAAQQRPQGRSDANIMRVRTQLEAVIDNLRRDQSDYGGHKAKAEELLQSARQELLAAEEFARSHGR